MKDAEHKPAALIFILITLFIDILGIGIVIPVLPALVKEFVGDNASRAGFYVGLIGASYAVMQFLFAPILGALSDRYGRRPIILASLVGLGIDFLIQGWAPTIGWLFAGRLVAGVMGASFTTANAYIADVSTPENRARNYGLMGVMFGLGFIVGPAMGGLLGSVWLRLPFFVSAGLAFANATYGFFVLPESLPPADRSKLRLRTMNPFGALEHLRNYPVVAGLAIAFTCMSFAQRGLERVWVLYTEYRYDWDTFWNGMVLGLVGVCATLVQGGLVRPMIKRFGERRTVTIGLVVSSIAFFGYSLAPEGWMIPWLIVIGSLGGVTGPAIQSIVGGAVQSSDQGKVQGSLTSLMSLTNIFAPLFFTTVVFGYFTYEGPSIPVPWLDISVPVPSVKLPGMPLFIGGLLFIVSLFIVRAVFRRHPEIVTDRHGAEADGSVESEELTQVAGGEDSPQ